MIKFFEFMNTCSDWRTVAYLIFIVILTYITFIGLIGIIRTIIWGDNTIDDNKTNEENYEE